MSNFDGLAQRSMDMFGKPIDQLARSELVQLYRAAVIMPLTSAAAVDEFTAHRNRRTLERAVEAGQVKVADDIDEDF